MRGCQQRRMNRLARQKAHRRMARQAPIVSVETTTVSPITGSRSLSSIRAICHRWHNDREDRDLELPDLCAECGAKVTGE